MRNADIPQKAVLATSSVSMLIASSASAAIEMHALNQSFDINNLPVFDNSLSSIATIMVEPVNNSGYIGIFFRDNDANGQAEINEIGLYTYNIGWSGGGNWHNIGSTGVVGPSTSFVGTAGGYSGLTYSVALPQTSYNGIINGETSYMGFQVEAAGGLVYGILEYVIDLSDPATASVEFLNSYIETSGAAIDVSAVVPEPKSTATALGVLALGAAGVMRNRRNRNAA